MPGVFYVLRLQESVLVNVFGGETNSAQTLSCIPGSVLRGAVIGAYQQQQPHAELDAADPDIRRLFQRSNALPPCLSLAEAYRARVLACPTLLAQDHGEQTKQPHQVYDLSIALDTTDEQLTGLGEGAYCVLIGQTAYTLARQEQLNVHTQRDAERGRATTEHGAVFFAKLCCWHTSGRVHPHHDGGRRRADRSAIAKAHAFLRQSADSWLWSRPH